MELHQCLRNLLLEHFNLDLLMMVVCLLWGVLCQDLVFLVQIYVLLSKACDNFLDRWCGLGVLWVLVEFCRLDFVECILDMSISFQCHLVP